jgi:hypothetical protein
MRVEGLMRIVTAFALLCAAVPAWAQTPAPAAAAKPQASAKPAAKQSGSAALPLAERISIQSDLIWTGDLNSIADGEWGDRSTAAVKAFQKRKGGKDTGVLSIEERAVLTAEARNLQDEVGWRIVTDDSGVRLGIPAKLVPQARKGRSGGSWQSARGDLQIEVFREPAPATLTAMHEQQRKNPSRKIEYTVRKADFFVISGTQGPKRFYMRVQAGPNEVRGVSLVYDPQMGDVMDRLVVAVSSAFTPFPATSQLAGRSVEKRKVEYATGVVVSASGDIVTDREAIEGCQVIVVAGLGNAERVAEDKAAGLALIRVYGAPGLKPLALGEAIRTEVTLVGIADPQSQAGRASVSMTQAKVTTVGDAVALDTAAAPGFAGAAAIDADVGFVGVVVQKPQFVAGPATGATSSIASSDSIRKLLAAQNIAHSGGQAGVDFAKDSVVRVVCVRK